MFGEYLEFHLQNQSFFTTNLLITLRLIKDLKQKRLYTQNCQDSCLLDLYRNLPLESICNFPMKGGFIAKCWITATATKVLLKPWQSLKGFLLGLQPITCQAAPVPSTALRTEPPTILHLFQPQQRVRKPWEPQVSPTLTYPPPPNHTFCPHIWLPRIKWQCKRPVKKSIRSSLPFSYSEHWCTWWAGNRHERLLFAITTLCSGSLTKIWNSQERANLHLTEQTLPYHLGSLSNKQLGNRHFFSVPLKVDILIL